MVLVVFCISPLPAYALGPTHRAIGGEGGIFGYVVVGLGILIGIAMLMIWLDEKQSWFDPVFVPLMLICFLRACSS